MNSELKKSGINYDYILIIATCISLFMIAAITVYGMFYFKIQGIGDAENPAVKVLYYQHMNNLISPFLSILLVILSICVPKRLFPFKALLIIAGLMIILTVALSFTHGNITALTVVLLIALLLQAVVLILVLGGLRLHFEKKGYLVRVGSSLAHFGFILFVLDYIMLKTPQLVTEFTNKYSYRPVDIDATHLTVFWISAAAMSIGCLLTFYTPDFSKKKRDQEETAEVTVD